MTDTELKALISRSLNARIDLFGELIDEELEASLFFDPLAAVIAPRGPYVLRPIMGAAEDGIDDEEFAKQSSLLKDKILVALKTEVPPYAWVFIGFIRIPAFGFFVPVCDAANKWRDQKRINIRTGNRLGHAKEEGKVTVDAFLLQNFGGSNAFPGRGELDENPVFADAARRVIRDDFARTGDGCVCVKGQAGVHFG